MIARVLTHVRLDKHIHFVEVPKEKCSQTLGICLKFLRKTWQIGRQRKCAISGWIACDEILSFSPLTSRRFRKYLCIVVFEFEYSKGVSWRVRLRELCISQDELSDLWRSIYLERDLMFVIQHLKVCWMICGNEWIGSKQPPKWIIITVDCAKELPTSIFRWKASVFPLIFWIFWTIAILLSVSCLKSILRITSIFFSRSLIHPKVFDNSIIFISFFCESFSFDLWFKWPIKLHLIRLFIGRTPLWPFLLSNILWVQFDNTFPLKSFRILSVRKCFFCYVWRWKS